MSSDQLKQYFAEHSDEINKVYFESLYRKFRADEKKEISIHHPKTNPASKVYPYAILDDKNLMPVSFYSDLKDENEIKSELRLIKMHAGIGSSVDRMEHLKKNSGRSALGAKGTDLFVEGKSLAQLQIEQVKTLNQNPKYKKVYLQNLVNEETKEIVESLNTAFNLPSITQYKMPSIYNGEPSFERLAPGGHGFLGFYLLMDLVANPVKHDQIIAIGNGEDLNSTPDLKILNWMEKTQTAICMITTDKTDRDKKGGQLAVVRGKTPYLTIIEKAQAEQAGQVDYFTELGLRGEDDISLFNTNIVLINSKILSGLLTGISESELSDIIAPDLIRNKKTQDGKEFIQLEGAIGSVMLNLDRYFREKHDRPLIRFLNLNPVERENFFIPIKKMEDFEDILSRYQYSKETGRFVL